jgi:hypothetical protein
MAATLFFLKRHPFDILANQTKKDTNWDKKWTMIKMLADILVKLSLGDH